MCCVLLIRLHSTPALLTILINSLTHSLSILSYITTTTCTYLVHASQLLHSETKQSAGHGWVLHPCTARSAGQSASKGARWITRCRDWRPLPHDLEHTDHLPQSDTCRTCMQYSYVSYIVYIVHTCAIVTCAGA